MSISLNTCILILKEHHLLKSSAVQDTVATKMDYVSYDSRDIQTNTLFSARVQALDQLIYQWLKTMVLFVTLLNNLILKAKVCTR